MSDFEKQLIYDLAKKYTFENFDFKSNSPEELLIQFQETSTKIQNLIENQNSKIAEENLKLFMDNL